MWRDLLAVAVGGAAGAVTRYCLSAWVHQRLGVSFPFGTLAVNVLGCFLLGVLAQYAHGVQDIPLQLRLLLATGGLGALTTFSTFGYETIVYYHDRGAPVALLNVLANLVLGITAVLLGIGVVKIASLVVSK